jgi:predicted Rossmann fold flavoprotein
MKQTAIIGGGAAGLCCACELLHLAQGRTQVTLFEQKDRVGKKLLMTGNGRCNLTNRGANAQAYPAAVRTFAAPALERFGPESTLQFFRRLSLLTRADGEGRVYPLSNQAAGVLDALRLEALRLGADLRCGTAVTALKPTKTGFLVNGEAFDCVVLAPGGKAAVRDFSDSLLRELSLPLTKTAPGLVKLITSDPMPRALKGVRARARLTLLLDGKAAAEETGELQFADGALSGIAAMNLSSVYARAGLHGRQEAHIAADFVPEQSADALKKLLQTVAETGQREQCEDLLSGLLAKKLGVALLKRAGIRPDLPTRSLTGAQLDALCEQCKRCRFPVTGTGSFADAQVTVGGLSQDGFNAATLESRQYPGLFACGEVLDVDGPCGGFNLQWAFASARLCAASVTEKLL